MSSKSKLSLILPQYIKKRRSSIPSMIDVCTPNDHNNNQQGTMMSSHLHHQRRNYHSTNLPTNNNDIHNNNNNNNKLWFSTSSSSSSSTPTVIIDANNNNNNNNGNTKLSTKTITLDPPIISGIKIPKIPKRDTNQLATTTTTLSNKKKKKKRIQQERSNKSYKKIQLLHFKEKTALSKEMIEETFDTVARKNDLHKFKWIESVHSQLRQYKKQQTTPAATATATTTTKKQQQQQQQRKRMTFLQKTQKLLKDKKTIPSKVVQDAFWDLLLVNSNNNNNNTNKSKKPKVNLHHHHPHYQRHVELFQTAREYSAKEFPFFWSANAKTKIFKRSKVRNNVYFENRKALLRQLHMEKEEESSFTKGSLEQDANEMVQFLYENLPIKSYEKIVTLFENYVSACQEQLEQQQEEKEENEMNINNNHLAVPPNNGKEDTSDSDSESDSESDDNNDDDNSQEQEGYETDSSSSSSDDDDDDEETLPNNRMGEKQQEQKTTTTTSKKKKKTNPQKKPFHIFFNHIQAQTKSHVHIVAPKLADFFYVTVNPDMNTRVDENGNIIVNAKDTTATTNTTTMVSSDSRIKESQMLWKKAREKYVKSFLAIQSILLEEYHQTKTTKTKASMNTKQQDKDTVSISESSSSSSSDTRSLDSSVQSEHDDDDDDDEMELIDDDDDDDDNDQSEEEGVLETFEDAAAISAAAAAVSGGGKPVGTVNNPMKQQQQQQQRPRKYIVFEAMAVGDWATNIGNNNNDTLSQYQAATTVGTPFEGFPTIAPVDRIVFLDNLPIDITKDRLIEAYSRCGDIEAIQIFHQRTDLDPGRRSIDARKKIRKPSSSKQKWRRPRTPLYATILFQDSAGAAKAVVDPLRIFGMVLDKHLIRSYRPEDMTTLYLEDVVQSSSSSSQEHQDVTSMEYELSQLLHPELYLCLDVDKRQGRSVLARNCKIKFPNFEAAYWSYLKLSSELKFLQNYNDDDDDDDNDDDSDVNKCALHWMETPTDAMMYWTRQLNF